MTDPNTADGGSDEPQYVEYVEILGTYNTADVAFIKSILEPSGIAYYIADEHFAIVRPAAQPARVMVEKERVQDAVALLKDLDLNFMLLNLKPEEENPEKE